MKNTKLLKTKKDREQFLLWIDWLLSGALPKGVCRLTNSHGEYCCLGVACVVLIPEERLSTNIEGYITGYHPRQQGGAPKWLKVINDDFKYRTGKSLIDLNDSYISHPKIARRLLEAYKDELDLI